MRAQSILIVDDDPRMLCVLESHLSLRGFQVRVASSGVEAVAAVAEAPPDLMLLDLMLPGKDGMTVCRDVRASSDLPIIVLTVNDAAESKVTALEYGADDYLTKPCHMGELVARIRAVLRRAGGHRVVGPAEIQFGPLRICFVTREVSGHGASVRLTRTEAELLRLLATNEGTVLLYDYLLKRVWGPEYGNVRTVHVHICNLRRKLETARTARPYILPVGRVGYRFCAGETTESAPA